MVREIFISVDIEASGPIPGEFSMLSIGACVVGATHEQFYVELKPISSRHDPEAVAVSGLSLADLERHGHDPAGAMAGFEAWIAKTTPEGCAPVFVAYPVAFDWMFVAYYFHRFLGRNPFGIQGLDMTSFYVGMTGRGYLAKGASDLEPSPFADLALTHNALDDAVVQAHVFEALLRRRGEMR